MAAEIWRRSKSAAIWGAAAVALTQSGRQPVTQSRHGGPSWACHAVPRVREGGGRRGIDLMVYIIVREQHREAVHVMGR
jgi:hypothetical protein